MMHMHVHMQMHMGMGMDLDVIMTIKEAMMGLQCQGRW